MDKKIDTFMRLETPIHLLQGLDAVGLIMRKNVQSNQQNALVIADSLFSQPLHSYERFPSYIGLNLSACNLLAAILEGCLRALFVGLVHRDKTNIGKMSSQFRSDDKKYKAITRSYGRLKHLSDAVEFNGSWANLKEHYREYLDVNLCSGQVILATGL